MSCLKIWSWSTVTETSEGDATCGLIASRHKKIQESFLRWRMRPRLGDRLRGTALSVLPRSVWPSSDLDFNSDRSTARKPRRALRSVVAEVASDSQYR